MREDADLRWERGEVADRPALLVRDSDHPKYARAYVAPDLEHAWRWTTAERTDEAGEYLPVHEVLARVPAAYRDWVRQATDDALGQVSDAIAAVTARARATDDADAFSELARLAEHAHDLAAARHAEPFTPDH